jgi:mannose-1-phosphate guanylyltransferase/phosphomannomutase
MQTGNQQTNNTINFTVKPNSSHNSEINEMFDFSKDLFPILLRKDLPMYGYIIEDYWCDIGDPGVYIQSHIDIMDGKVNINIPGKQIREKVWVGEGTVIDEKVDIESPCIIGKHTRIKNDSFIGRYTVIGDSNIIDAHSSINIPLHFTVKAWNLL